jgi:hypothetical protein
MSFDGSSHDNRGAGVQRHGASTSAMPGVGPGKSTLTSQLPLIQRKADGPQVAEGGDVHAAAAHGTKHAGGALPHGDVIQRAFGDHDVSHIQAHVGGQAAEGAAAMGAQAYATGNQVAFASQPDLHTAAHEAAHVVQQRAGVSLKGGVGEDGDSHEKHADAVADAVVAGQSAESLLDGYAGGGAHDHAGEARTQHKRNLVQMRGGKAVAEYEDTQLKAPFTDAHIFSGEVKDGEPKGLHAYKNSVAGDAVEVLATLGNVNGVHVVIWTKGAAKTAKSAKWSSMFPQAMHKGIAAWYINSGPGLVDGTGVKDGKNAKVGTGWGPINVSHVGDTAYPSGGPSWQTACKYDGKSKKWTLIHGGVTYTIANP